MQVEQANDYQGHVRLRFRTKIITKLSKILCSRWLIFSTASENTVAEAWKEEPFSQVYMDIVIS